MRVLYIAVLVVVSLEVVSCIINGEESKPGQWPFMAALFNDHGFRCGGVVWNERIIITTASCAFFDTNGKINVKYAYLGSNEHLRSKMNPTYVFGVDLEKKEMFNITQWHSERPAQDIALLTLNRTIDFNGVNSKVRCVGEPIPPEYVEKNHCVSIGWGVAGYTETPTLTLKHAQTQIQTQQICADNYKFYNPNLDRHICAGDHKGKVVYLDNGSPLMCPIKGYPSRYKLVAIAPLTSSMHTNAEYFTNDDPGIYCQIDYYYYDWIVEKAGRPCTII